MEIDPDAVAVILEIAESFCDRLVKHFGRVTYENGKWDRPGATWPVAWLQIESPNSRNIMQIKFRMESISVKTKWVDERTYDGPIVISYADPDYIDNLMQIVIDEMPSPIGLNLWTK